MMTNPPLGPARRRVPEITTLSVIVIACLALVGWITDSPVLKSVIPTLPPMRPNTAVGLIVGSASLWLLTRRPLNHTLRTLGSVCAWMVAILGVMTLVERLLGLNLGVDTWLLQSKLEAADLPGKLPVSTALSFLMCALALLTVHIETRSGSRPAELLALSAVVICLMTLLSYGYGIAEIYHFNPGMAINTAVAFILLSAGIL